MATPSTTYSSRVKLVLNQVPSVDNEDLYKDLLDIHDAIEAILIELETGEYNAGWSISGNVVATVIPVINDPVLIGTDNITIDADIEGFTFSGVTLTYDGEVSKTFVVSANLILSVAVATQKIGAEIFKNGLATGIRFTATTYGTADKRIEGLVVLGRLALEIGDTIDIRLFNTTATNDITVEDAILQLTPM